MTWTQFMDMHSGGDQKLDWAYIYIEAQQSEAEIIFYHRFGHSPHRVSCTCCGEDYSLTESQTLEHATAHNRGLRFAEDRRGWLYGKARPADYRDGLYLEPGQPVPEGMRVKETYRAGEGIPLDEYLRDSGVKVIYAHEIQPEERRGALPTEGYVWID